MSAYTRASEECKKAWFEYKRQYRGAGIPSVTSFVAGWNAAEGLTGNRNTLAAKFGKCSDDGIEKYWLFVEVHSPLGESIEGKLYYGETFATALDQAEEEMTPVLGRSVKLSLEGLTP